MTWRDKLLKASIETPDTNVYEFSYGDVEKTIKKKTSQYQFGDQEGTYVQDFGLGMVSYPLTIYFNGADYDIDANAFEISASEAGFCTLTHPVYGVKYVVIEELTRKDNLKTAANEAVFVLTITETLVDIYPAVTIDSRSGLVILSDSLETNYAEAFDNGIDVSDIKDKVKLKDRVLNFTNKFAKTFKNMANTVQDVTNEINAAKNYINKNIDNLLGSPLELARSVQRLIKAPAAALASIKNRLNNYKSQYQSLMADPLGTGKNGKNQRHENQMIIGSLYAGMVQVCLNPTDDLKTRSQASAFAIDMIDQYYVIQEYFDSMHTDETLEDRFVSSDEGARLLKAAASAVAKYLIGLAFSLKQERKITYDTFQNILDVCYELYGSTSNDTLDLFIQSNNLIGEEIIEIPAGRDIVYYV